MTTSLEGLTGGAAGSDAADATSTDAAALLDADVPPSDDASDASIDGGPPVDACSNATFCDGFERSVVRGSWNDEKAGQGSTLTLTTEGARSGASALRVSMGGGEGLGGFVSKPFPAARTIVLSYAFRINGNAPPMNLVELSFSLGGTSFSLFVIAAEGRAKLAGQEFVDGKETFFETSPSVPAVIGRWVVVELTTDLASRRLTATLDGERVLDGTELHATPTNVAGVYVGVTYTRAGPPVMVDFDDVRIVVTPP